MSADVVTQRSLSKCHSHPTLKRNSSRQGFNGRLPSRTVIWIEDSKVARRPDMKDTVSSSRLTWYEKHGDTCFGVVEFPIHYGIMKTNILILDIFMEDNKAPMPS